jgi:hypothetical protein
MNQNLMNPEIVLRMAHEREQELRRQVHGLREAEIYGESPAMPRARKQAMRPLTFMARLLAFVIH